MPMLHAQEAYATQPFVCSHIVHGVLCMNMCRTDANIHCLPCATRCAWTPMHEDVKDRGHLLVDIQGGHGGDILSLRGGCDGHLPGSQSAVHAASNLARYHFGRQALLAKASSSSPEGLLCCAHLLMLRPRHIAAGIHHLKSSAAFACMLCKWLGCHPCR